MNQGNICGLLGVVCSDGLRDLDDFSPLLPIFCPDLGPWMVVWRASELVSSSVGFAVAARVCRRRFKGSVPCCGNLKYSSSDLIHLKALFICAIKGNFALQVSWLTSRKNQDILRSGFCWMHRQEAGRLQSQFRGFLFSTLWVQLFFLKIFNTLSMAFILQNQILRCFEHNDIRNAWHRGQCPESCTGTRWDPHRFGTNLHQDRPGEARHTGQTTTNEATDC